MTLLTRQKHFSSLLSLPLLPSRLKTNSSRGKVNKVHKQLLFMDKLTFSDMSTKRWFLSRPFQKMCKKLAIILMNCQLNVVAEI